MGTDSRLVTEIERRPDRRATEPALVTGKSQMGEWINRLWVRVLELEQQIADPDGPNPQNYSTANLALADGIEKLANWSPGDALPELSSLEFQRELNEYLYGAGANNAKAISDIKADYAPKGSIPKKNSQLENDSGFITAGDVPATDLSDYATKAYSDSADQALDAKIAQNASAIAAIDTSGDGPDLSDYCTTAYSDQKDSDLNASLGNRIDANGASISTNADNITSLQTAFDAAAANMASSKSQLEVDLQSYAKKDSVYTKAETDAKVPSKTSALENDSGFITSADVPASPDLSPYAKKSELPKKTSQLENDSGYITAADVPAGGSDFSGSYNDLTDKPNIPSKTSQLQNDSGFVTADDVPAAPDLSSYAKKSEIPTDNKDLANGANYAKKSELPDLSPYATREWVEANKASSVSIDWTALPNF